MTKRLRLTREEPQQPVEVSARGRTPFPARERRERLVAGRVESDPRAGATAPDDDRDPPALRLCLDTDSASVETTPGLIRQIEGTLDRVQTRLRKLQREVEGTYKFPSPPEGHGGNWPPRAA